MASSGFIHGGWRRLRPADRARLDASERKRIGHRDNARAAPHRYWCLWLTRR
jgi:hypothetical protein